MEKKRHPLSETVSHSASLVLFEVANMATGAAGKEAPLVGSNLVLSGELVEHDGDIHDSDIFLE